MITFFNKKLAQKGGLMVEALAMLGLIAVVTPTMYKKSAERTLEVEDINTATAMRSVMGATDSYVSSKYGEIVQQMVNNHDQKIRKVDLDQLKEYLPYGFNTDKLYDFEKPKVTIVRNGNSLTSFVLFPAKESEENGLGQERTVRLATLIGANGGYVNGENSARGIGGIWNLSQSTDVHFSDVFDSSGIEAGQIYNNSIVMSSSDAINNTNTEEDSDKFLYRTDGNGKWHNTMRADLFLGGFSAAGDEGDGYVKPDNYSIRNVKRLILGANSIVSGTTEETLRNQDTINEVEDATDNPNRSYALYIKDDINTENKIDSAFIRGSLEAAESNLQVHTDKLRTGKIMSGDTAHYTLEVSPRRLTFGEGGTEHFVVADEDISSDTAKGYTGKGRVINTGNIYLAAGSATNDRQQTDENGVPQTDSSGNPIMTGQEWKEVKIGNLGSNRYLVHGDAEEGVGRLSFLDENTVLLKGKTNNATTDFADRIIINDGSDKRTYFQKDINGTIVDVKLDEPGTAGQTYAYYSNFPTFPVRIGSNTKVDGTLGADQLDTANIRAARIEVGSEMIDDPIKWLRVDERGIHGTNYAQYSIASSLAGEAPADKIISSLLEVHHSAIGIGTGTKDTMETGDNYETRDGNYSRKNLITINKDAGMKMLSSQALDLFTINESAPLSLSNTKLKQEIKNDALTISSKQEGTYTTGVKIENSNLELKNNIGNIVLEVKGNNSSLITKNPRTDLSNVAYDTALHGSTVFTSAVEPSDTDTNGKVIAHTSPNHTYLSMSDDYDTNAAVNIKQGNIDLSSANNTRFKQILTIDGNSDYTAGRPDYSTDANGGTVYIRKGMMEVNPVSAGYFSATDDATKISKVKAHEGYGVVKASRFVANNPNVNGETIAPNAVPPLFDDTLLKKYNGDNVNRYDTYMVNPAYTSVMHDIKLTTRGGARLSDILPDFINKGIYVTSNTYKDDISNLKFKFDSSSGVVPDSGTASHPNGTISIGGQDSWASPYLGFVPAPQCPPGYNRLITLAPQSFMMAQAGQMQRGQQYKRNGSSNTADAYYVKSQVPHDTAFTNLSETFLQNNAYVSQVFAEAKGNENVKVYNSGGTEVGTAQTKDMQVVATNSLDQTSAKFLVSFGDETVPLTIQQSTWLKTNVIPVSKNGASSGIGSAAGGYTLGWAAIMGFVYDAATYNTIITRLRADHNLIEYGGSDGNVYWNVFPVRRNTLEAYATTYCYFDRNNIMNEVGNHLKDSPYIDNYNAFSDYKTYDNEKKHGSDVYKNRLNDPTLKYNEVW